MKNIHLHIIKDYPKPGINFIDINPLFQNPTDFEAIIAEFCARIKNAFPATPLKDTAIIAPEARGFLFASPVALTLKMPLLLIRKQGKIPNNPYPFHITNEYTSYNMEVDGDLLENFSHFIYIDDILATGQTLACVRRALQAKNKEIILAAHLMDVKDLKFLRDQNKDLQNLPLEIIL